MGSSITCYRGYISELLVITRRSLVYTTNCCNKRVPRCCLDGRCSSVVISREESRPRMHTRRPALVCAKGSLLCAPLTTQFQEDNNNNSKTKQKKKNRYTSTRKANNFLATADPTLVSWLNDFHDRNPAIVQRVSVFFTFGEKEEEEKQNPGAGKIILKNNSVMVENIPRHSNLLALSLAIF